MNLTEEIKQTWIDKDRDKMSKVVQKQYDYIIYLNFESSEETFKENSGFPIMIDILNKSYKEENYSKCLYIIDKFIENYNLVIKKKITNEELT